MMWKNLFCKGLLVCSIVLLFWFMQVRVERSQRALAQKEEQCLALQNANKKQQENITKLLQEQKKQEELLIQLEQEKQNLVQAYQKKLAQVYKAGDKASTDWKQTKIPAPVLKILKQK